MAGSQTALFFLSYFPNKGVFVYEYFGFWLISIVEAKDFFSLVKSLITMLLKDLVESSDKCTVATCCVLSTHCTGAA